MSSLNDNPAERARVFSRIAPVIAEFHGVTGEQEFHVEDLRRYVLLRVPEVAPDSPGRILRELRLRRHLDYVVINNREGIADTWASILLFWPQYRVVRAEIRRIWKCFMPVPKANAIESSGMTANRDKAMRRRP